MESNLLEKEIDSRILELIVIEGPNNSFNCLWIRDNIPR